MSLTVIGAGFPRTGTASLKAALEQLGLGACYHMSEVFPRPDPTLHRRLRLTAVYRVMRTRPRDSIMSG